MKMATRKKSNGITKQRLHPTVIMAAWREGWPVLSEADAREANERILPPHRKADVDALFETYERIMQR